MRIHITFTNKKLPKKDGSTVGSWRYNACLRILKTIKDNRYNSKKDLYEDMILYNKINSKFACGLHNFPSEVKGYVDKAIKDGYLKMKKG